MRTEPKTEKTAPQIALYFIPFAYLCRKTAKKQTMDTVEKITEEIKSLEEEIKANPTDDTLHYRLGNLHRKTGNWKEAVKCYLAATGLNPASPAAEAYKSIMEILEFYNRDLYNP